MISPVPWQRPHGREVMTLPRKERCTCWISPVPLQSPHTFGLAFDFEPVPSQMSHSTAVSTVIGLRTPVKHSSRPREMRSSASEPGWTRERR